MSCLPLPPLPPSRCGVNGFPSLRRADLHLAVCIRVYRPVAGRILIVADFARGGREMFLATEYSVFSPSSSIFSSCEREGASLPSAFECSWSGFPIPYLPPVLSGRGTFLVPGWDSGPTLLVMGLPFSCRSRSSSSRLGWWIPFSLLPRGSVGYIIHGYPIHTCGLITLTYPSYSDSS